jgi:hypothetical protein
MAKKFITKDSGQRVNFSSGMRRDTDNGKPRFDLILPPDQQYNETLLYRWAMLMARGADKYGERNWEKSNSIKEFNRFKSSLFRHFMQFISNEDDGEDHTSAICFNLNAVTYLMNKLNIDINGEPKNKKGGAK